MRLIPTRCAICGSLEDFTVLYKNNFSETNCTFGTFSARKIPDRIHYQIVQCRHDKLVRSNPVLEESDLKEFYAKSKFTYEDEAGNLAETYAAALEPVLLKLPKTARVLEIGCGNGFLLKRLQELGYQNVFGVEPSVDAIAKADETVKEKITAGMLRGGIFEPGTFDMVCFFQTFDHIQDPNAFLKICYDLLVPGGTIVAFNHDVESLQAKILKEKSPIIDIGHAYLYSQETMKKIFEKDRFRSLKVYTPENVISLKHLLRLSPLPKALKEKLLGVKVGFFSDFLKLTVRVRLGNLCLIAVKDV